MKKLPLLLVTFIVLATSCTSKYAIKGSASLSQLSGKTIYIKALNDESRLVTVDSAQIVHGEFIMTGPSPKTPQMVTLFMDDMPMTPLILEPGIINISISSSDLVIEGTPLNNALYSFYQENQQLESKIERSLMRHESNTMYHSMIDEHQTLIKNFLEYNQNNILGPTVYSIYHNQYPEIFCIEDLEESSNPFSQRQEIMEVYNSLLNTPYRETYTDGFFLW